MDFAKSVFINCPFDRDYYPLLRPILFTVIYLGLKPRIALEELDSGMPRMAKISQLIAESQYAIHDLSRIEAKSVGELYRLNMPFELGLDVGCRLFGNKGQKTKKCLVLEAEAFRYKAALSDLSGYDIAAHGNDPPRVVTEVRNWLKNVCKLAPPGPTSIWNAFNDFMAVNYDDLSAKGYSDADIEALPVYELIECIESWTRTAK
ncbi:MAG: hypothetical protein ACK5OQ_15465 [Burkholderiales bacterium]|jgi:hypothetical protein